MPSKNNVTQKKSDKEEFKKNKLEWSVFSISSLLLLGLIGYLCYEMFTHKASPPDLKISYQKDSPGNGLSGYKVFLENIGNETAEDVKIEALLLKKDTVIDRSELQIAFSPKRSKREGWINFSTNPSEADSMRVTVISYKKP